MTDTEKTPTYTNLLGFLIPLAFIPFMQGLGRQFTNAGMARMPEEVTTFAAYGLVFGLMRMLSSPLMHSRNLGIILTDSRQAFRQILKFLAVFSLIPVILLTAISFTPAGKWVITDLHHASADLTNAVLFACMFLIPIPFFISIIGLETGVLINAHRTVLISAASLLDIIIRISLVFILLHIECIRTRPVLLPVIVIYGGMFTRIIILGLPCLSCMRHLPETGNKHLSFGYILHFFWPLALLQVIVGGSRPLINMLVSRGTHGREALAVLAVVFPLANLQYGWVNQNRSLVAAFRNHRGSRGPISRFAFGCGIFSFLVMVILFWTPLRNIILLDWIELSADIVPLCTWPLILFSFFPLAVMVRSYFQGIALAEHRTIAVMPSALCRLTSILVVYCVLSFTPLHSATTGAAALLSGFMVEAAVIRFSIRRGRHNAKKTQKK